MKRLILALCLAASLAHGQSVSQLPPASAMHTNDLFSVSQPTGTPPYTTRSLTGAQIAAFANGQSPANVASLNTLTGAVTLTAGTNISITNTGNAITINSTATGVSWPLVSTDGKLSFGSTAGTAGYIDDSGNVLGNSFTIPAKVSINSDGSVTLAGNNFNVAANGDTTVGSHLTVNTYEIADASGLYYASGHLLSNSSSIYYASGQALTDGTSLFLPNGTAVGAGSPGGSSGQIQYNNSGSFGGLTNTGIVYLTSGAPSAATQAQAAALLNSGTLAYALGTDGANNFYLFPSGNASVGFASDLGDTFSVNGTIRQGVTSSVLKANGNGEISAATAGTDYALPYTFTAPLTNNAGAVSITPNSFDAFGSASAAQTAAQAYASNGTNITSGTIAYSKLFGTPTLGTMSTNNVPIPYGYVSGTPSSLPPNGTAGGDLFGNYPNPSAGNAAHLTNFPSAATMGLGSAATSSSAAFAPATGSTNYASIAQVPFDFTQVSNLKIWVDPSSSVTMAGVTNNGSISTLFDRAGSTNTIIQPTSANQPKWEATGINGMPAILWSYNSVGMHTGFNLDSTFNTSFTWACVVYNNVLPTTTRVSNQILFSTDDALALSYNCGGAAQSGESFFSATIHQNAASVLANFASPNDVMVYVVTYDGTTYRNYINGMQLVPTTYSGSIGSTANINIGCSGIGTGQGFQGYMGDMALWAHAASATEAQKISLYLMNKYNLPKRQLVYTGDSLLSGLLSNPTSMPEMKIEALLGGAGTWLANVPAVSGFPASGASNQFLYAQAPGIQTDRQPVCIYWLGANDISGSTAATIQTETTSNCQALQAMGYKVVVCTLLPYVSAAVDAVRLPVNTYIRTNYPAFADGIADLANDPTIGAVGAETNTTYYYSDGKHLLDSGYNIASPLIANSVSQVLQAKTGAQFGYLTSTTSFTAKPGINIFTGTNASQTVTLPQPMPTPSTSVFIKNQSSVSITITSATNSEIIPSGATTPTNSIIFSSGASGTGYSDGTNWNF